MCVREQGLGAAGEEMPALSSPNSQQRLELALCKLSSEMQMQITADKYRAAASEECPQLCLCCALGAGFHVANADCALV